MSRGLALQRTATDASTASGLTGVVYIRPIDGIVDDVPQLETILASYAGVKDVVMLPGINGEEWQFLTPCNVPNNSNIALTSATVIHCDIPAPGIGNGAWVCIGTGSENIAVTANNTVGSLTIQMDTSPVVGVGGWFELQVTAAHLHGGLYQIVSITPNGANFDVVVDRPILYTALSASANVLTLAPVSQNIVINGNGALMYGRCSSYIVTNGCVDCHFSNLVLDAYPSDVVAAGVLFDTFTLRCTLENIRHRGTTNANHVGFLLIGESLTTWNLFASDCLGAGSGMLVTDCVESDFYNTTLYNNSFGLKVSADGGANFDPSESLRFVGGSIYGNVGTGIQLDNGTRDVVFEGFSVRYHLAASGVTLLATQGNITRVRFVGCTFSNNQNGFVDIAGSTRIVLDDCDVSGNSSVGILCTGEIICHGLTSNTGNGTAVINMTGAGKIYVDGFDIVGTNANNPVVQAVGTCQYVLRNGHITVTASGEICVYGQGTSQGTVENVRFTFSAANGYCFTFITGAVCSIAHVRADGANIASAGGINAGAGATMRLGPRVDFDNLATPYNYQAGTFWSKSLYGAAGAQIAGTFVTILGAGAAVVVAWPDLKRADMVKLSRVTNPAAVQPSPLVTQVAGTGFTVTPIGVGDAAAVYAVDIG